MTSTTFNPATVGHHFTFVTNGAENTFNVQLRKHTQIKKNKSDVSQDGHELCEPVTLYGRQSTAPWRCSQQQVTVQSVALHNSISYTDENCDSASVSQRLRSHLHL